MSKRIQYAGLNEKYSHDCQMDRCSSGKHFLTDFFFFSTYVNDSLDIHSWIKLLINAGNTSLLFSSKTSDKMLKAANEVKKYPPGQRLGINKSKMMEIPLHDKGHSIRTKTCIKYKWDRGGRLIEIITIKFHWNYVTESTLAFRHVAGDTFPNNVTSIECNIFFNWCTPVRGTTTQSYMLTLIQLKNQAVHVVTLSLYEHIMYPHLTVFSI